MKEEHQIKAAFDQYAHTIRRICFLHLKNYHDVEDVFQEVFLKYALREEPFESHAHEKAWLIRIAINSCKDILKSFFKRKVTSFEDQAFEPSYLPEGSCPSEESSKVLDAVLKLPEKYRITIYMFYYEGYSAVEIAHMLGKKENTVYTWLTRARKQLKSSLEDDLLGQ